MLKKSLKYILLLVVLALMYVGYTQYPKFVLISGFSAKNTASGIFVADRTQNSIEETDNNFSPVTWAENVVDLKNKSVTSKVFGLKTRTAIYREGLGTVVTNDEYDETVPFLTPNRKKTPKNLPFPYGELPQEDTLFQNVNYDKLETLVDTYFNKNTKENTTRSLLIIYKNQIIAERYAEGFSKDTRILGWSMAKSVVSAVYGVLDQQGRIKKDDVTGIAAWKNDDRSKITIGNLLQMNSGLAWEEDYTKISDVTKMLYLDSDLSKAQVDKPLAGKPNETWYYSSGTTNLLSGLLRQKFKTHQEYLDFWYSDLIDKIGMHSMLVEADLAGNYIASAYVWANTRDWAKFGLLYLNKGNWNGEQIISKDWVKYTAEPTPTSDGVYGAQFWLNSGGHLPDVPRDLYFADGFQGQRVFIIPSKDLVVVRMGVSHSDLAEKLKQRPIQSTENKEVVKFELNNQDSNVLLKDIISAISN